MKMAPAKQERVVLVGKTRMGGGVCVGGMIESTGRSVRILPPGGFCHPPDTAFQVGDVWQMTLRRRDGLEPPHTEDHDESCAMRLGSIEALARFVQRVGAPYTGEPAGLFGGALRFRNAGSAYLPKVTPLPDRSVEFWITPRVMVHSMRYDKSRYQMQGRPSLSLPYVGHDTPLPMIPAGTLVRLSLARWWTNPQAPEEGPGCSLQLSGWLGMPVDAQQIWPKNFPRPTSASSDDEIPF